MLKQECGRRNQVDASDDKTKDAKRLRNQPEGGALKERPHQGRKSQKVPGESRGTSEGITVIEPLLESVSFSVS